MAKRACLYLIDYVRLIGRVAWGLASTAKRWVKRYISRTLAKDRRRPRSTPRGCGVTMAGRLPDTKRFPILGWALPACCNKKHLLTFLTIVVLCHLKSETPGKPGVSHFREAEIKLSSVE